jgi:YihY family inner membrane protein
LGHVIVDVVRHLRRADGTSHTRSLAFQTLLALFPGFIAVVGLASLLHLSEVRRIVQGVVSSVSPGPSGKLLQEAAKQGARGSTAAVLFGLAAAIIAGMFAMAQVERSGNRIQGLDTDRSTGRRYAVALLLAIPVGVLLTLGGLLVGAGGAVIDGLGLKGAGRSAWEILRWPAGLLLVGAGLLLMLRAAPRRRLGSTRNLLMGAAVAVLLWVAFTALLGFYFAISASASQTYGPLLAVIALLVWAELTSLALHLGMTTVVELEHPGSYQRTGTYASSDSSA